MLSFLCASSSATHQLVLHHLCYVIENEKNVVKEIKPIPRHVRQIKKRERKKIEFHVKFRFKFLTTPMNIEITHKISPVLISVVSVQDSTV